MNYSNFDVRLRVNPRQERDPRRQESARKGAAPSGASSRRVLSAREKATKGVVRATVVALAALLAIPFLHATTVSMDAPTSDRWMYPFASNPGNETSAAVFGDVGDTSGAFDERDGQMLLGFGLSGLVTTGQGASNYLVSAVTITLTLSNSIYIYDPTYDSYKTYLDSSASNYVADSDAGRPVELYGVGFRNGYTAQSFAETSPYGTMVKGGRNAYAMDYVNGVAADVSNNVSGGFETSPWALGTTDAVNPGDVAPAGTTLTFTLDLTNPYVLAYVQAALNSGTLDFMVTSLSAASQPGTSGAASYPSFYTKESLIGTPATISIDYLMVPEPASGLMAISGAVLLFMRRRTTEGRP